jgi:hypothetical protein
MAVCKFYQEGRKMGYGGMPGVPLIASSPVRHDSPLNLHGLEVTSYQPPWKALSDFALHADLDNNGVNHTPAFQHLVNQASHHHFSYFYSAARKTLIFCHFFFARSFLSTHSFHSVLVPSILSIFSLYYLFACLFGFFCLSFFFSAFCLDIYSFHIFLFFKSAKLFLQIKRWPSSRWLDDSRKIFCSGWRHFDYILLSIHRCTATMLE